MMVIGAAFKIVVDAMLKSSKKRENGKSNITQNEPGESADLPMLGAVLATNQTQ
jgi:hypothetical protein